MCNHIPSLRNTYNRFITHCCAVFPFAWLHRRVPYLQLRQRLTSVTHLKLTQERGDNLLSGSRGLRPNRSGSSKFDRERYSICTNLASKRSSVVCTSKDLTFDKLRSNFPVTRSRPATRPRDVSVHSTSLKSQSLVLRFLSLRLCQSCQCIPSLAKLGSH